MRLVIFDKGIILKNNSSQNNNHLINEFTRIKKEIAC